MKINVILTGGTIGSSYGEKFISPDCSAKYLLINNYKAKYGDDVEFSVQSPYTILSENLSGEYLNLLISVVKKSLDSDADGIIVAHGTDTLQYSACATAYCVGSNTKPIIFVSANYPLENPLSNGNINFAAAVEFIKQGSGKSVYVSYSNDLKTVDFHFATKLLRHGEYDHKVYSLNGVYATYENHKITLNPDFFAQNIKPLQDFDFYKDPGILNITVSPFENYSYDLSGVKAVIFTPYHSGTLNTDSSFLKNFCEKAKKNKIPIYLTGVVKGGEYLSMKKYNEMNITPVFNETSIALSVKLWLGL